MCGATQTRHSVWRRTYQNTMCGVARNRMLSGAAQYIIMGVAPHRSGKFGVAPHESTIHVAPHGSRIRFVVPDSSRIRFMAPHSS